MLPAPVVVEVRDQNHLRYSGAPLTLTPTAGSSVDSGSIFTDADGRASIPWRLGSERASLEVRLGDSGPTVTAQARLGGGLPMFSSTAVVNAASFNIDKQSAGISPGSLVTVFGVDLAHSLETAAGFPLPRTLGGARVRINGVDAPLVAAMPGQLNLQAPFELQPGPVGVSVSTQSGDSVEATIFVADVDPGIFFDSASGYGAIRYPADGQIAFQRPARPGEGLEIYVTGLGAVDPRTETGEASRGFILSHVRAEVVVLLDGRRITPIFAGLAPSFAGLYQVSVVLPDDLLPGSYELRLEVAGIQSNPVRLDIGAPL